MDLAVGKLAAEQDVGDQRFQEGVAGPAVPQRPVRDTKQKDANCARVDYSPLPRWTARR